MDEFYFPICSVCEKHEDLLYIEPVLNIVVCGKECQRVALAVDVLRTTHVSYMKQWTMYLVKSMEEPLNYAAPPAFLDNWLKLFKNREARAQWSAFTRTYKRYLVGTSPSEWPSMDTAINGLLDFARIHLSVDQAKLDQLRRGIQAHSDTLRTYRRYLSKNRAPRNSLMKTEVREAIGLAGRLGELMNKSG